MELDVINVEECRSGTGRWRNIQESVRVSVLALHTVATSQSQVIRALQAQTEALCSHLASQAARVEEVYAHTSSRFQALEEAVTAAGVSRTDAKAALVGRLETLEERVTNTQGMFRVLETQVASIEDLKGFATKAELAAKADLVAVQEALNRKASKDALRELAQAKADRGDIVARADIVSREDWGRISQELDRLERLLRDGLQEVGNGLSRKAGKAHLQETRTELEKMLRDHVGEISAALLKKASKVDLDRALTTKADAFTSDARVRAAHEEMLRLLQQKADAADLSQLKKRPDGAQIRALQDAQAELQRQIMLKADATEVRVVNSTCADLRRALDQKADATEVEGLRHALQATPTSFRRPGDGGGEGAGAPVFRQAALSPTAVRAHGGSDTSVRAAGTPSRPASSPVRHALSYSGVPQARWVWKSSELREGKVVPWEVEAVNEAPDLFLWRAGRGVITTVKPGLYQACLAFFSPTPPTITLFVNDSAAISNPPRDSPVAVMIHRHPAGCVGGTCMVQFLALPAQAQVSVVFDGDTKGQGFLWLQKL